jgi:hypothetical protein
MFGFSDVRASFLADFQILLLRRYHMRITTFREAPFKMPKSSVRDDAALFF